MLKENSEGPTRKHCFKIQKSTPPPQRNEIELKRKNRDCSSVS